MNRLGFCATATGAGFRKLFLVNEDGKWDRPIGDIRQIQGLFSPEYYAQNGYAIGLNFSETGCYIMIIRAIPGRDLDNICSWIFVPRGLQVRGEQLSYLVSEIIKENAKSQMDVNNIKAIFATNYPTCTALAGKASAREAAYAVRYYENGSRMLTDLLDNLFQPQYTNFSYVFLLTNGVKIAPQYASQVANITSTRIQRTVTVIPPRSNDFTPFLGNTPFTSPVSLTEGEIINITWKRNGYRDIIIGDTVSTTQPLQIPTPDQYDRAINYNMFKVTSVGGTPVHDYTIVIDSQRLLPNQPVYISESRVRNVSIHVEATGFKPFSQKADLSKNNRLEIHLESGGGVKHTLSFEGQSDITFSSRSREVPNVIRIDSTEYKNSSASKSFTGMLMSLVPGILFSLVIGAGLWCGYTLFGGDEKTTPKTEIAENGEDGTEESGNGVSDEDLQKAKEYLTNNNTWSSQELENNPATAGLYDALNNYDVDKALDILSQFSSVPNVGSVCSHLRTCKDSGWIDAAKKKFPYANDGLISVQNYCNWVDRQCVDSGSGPSSTTSSVQSTPTSQPHKENIETKPNKQVQAPVSNKANKDKNENANSNKNKSGKQGGSGNNNSTTTQNSSSSNVNSNNGSNASSSNNGTNGNDNANQGGKKDRNKEKQGA